MKESFWGASFVIMGIIGIGLILLFVNLTVNDQNDYYLLKEVTEASMIDAIDVDYYRYHGEFRIVRERFVESFIRRWSTSTTRKEDITIEINDVVEMPPKVSVTVTSQTDKVNFATDVTADGRYLIKNKIDAILEEKKKN